MKPGEIQFLNNYKIWANWRVLSVAASLTDEEFNQPLDFPHGGVRTTFVHLLSAEWIWRSRIQERVSPSKPLIPDDFPTLAVLNTQWEEENGKMQAYLAGLSEADLEQTVHYRRTDGSGQEAVLWQILLHLMNHATAHRSEIAAMLTSFQHSPGDLDISVYLRSLKA